MAIPLCLVVSMCNRCSQCPGPSPTLGSVGPLHQRSHKSQVLFRRFPCAQGILGTFNGEVRESKSCLFHGQTIKNWLCGTKPNHICATNGMLKVGFADQTKSCLSCGQNVRSWICGTKPNHVCAVGGMLEVGFVVLSQIIFVPQNGMLEVGFGGPSQIILLPWTEC